MATQLVRPIHTGADPQAGSYRADGGRALVVKVQSVPAAERAVTVAAALAPLSRSELLTPVLTGDGAPYLVLEDQGMVVWPFRAGQTGFERYQTPATLARVGGLLRAVHDREITPELHRVLAPDRLEGGFRAETRRWLSLAAPPDAVGERFAELLRRHGHRWAATADAADRLAADLPAVDPVLCHGDLHAGNVLVGPDGSLTVLDWDTAVLARRERDLMFAGAGIVATWTAGPEVAAFFRGYTADGPYEPDPAAIAYYRCDRICADFVVYARSVHDPGSPTRQADVAQLEAQTQPGDVLDRAERSLNP